MGFAYGRVLGCCLSSRPDSINVRGAVAVAAQWRSALRETRDARRKQRSASGAEARARRCGACALAAPFLRASGSTQAGQQEPPHLRGHGICLRLGHDCCATRRAALHPARLRGEVAALRTPSLRRY
eukprot:355986-Chlamydomonas_euryale.AAC.6